MPSMDRRSKGCRNVHCRYNKERKHLPLDYNYCPICGEKVGLVCRECFAEIEDLGKPQFRCDACEAKKAERAEEQREKLVKVGQQVKAKVAEPVLEEAMDAVKKVAVKKAVPAAGQAMKKVVPVAGKAVKKAIVRH